MSTLTSLFSGGLDSALCCVALGAATLSWRVRFRLAFAFGLCDTAGSMLGSVLDRPWPLPPGLALYLSFAVLLGLAVRRFPRLLWATPIVLSLDNLAIGGHLGDALADGMGSASLALLGLVVGAALRQRVIRLNR